MHRKELSIAGYDCKHSIHTAKSQAIRIGKKGAFIFKPRRYGLWNDLTELL